MLSYANPRLRLGFAFITVSNSPNPSCVYIRLCKHGKRFLLLNFFIFFPFSIASTTEVTTIPTSVLNQVMDQATLSTMQAEMIAVQVLSQSATGDIQYLQHQSPRFIPIVTSADPSTLNSLQATLSQMPLATLQVRMMDASMLCLKLLELKGLRKW